MGVTFVFNYPVPEGKSGQQTVEYLQKQIEMLGASKTGNFSVDCDTYQAHNSMPPPQKVVNVLHNSEQPASCFAVLDNGPCLVADSLFDLLMVRLKSFYVPKKTARVESKGQRYELCDFVIKIGSVVLGQSTSFKGVLVEVEYQPCVVPADCWGLTREFLAGFLGNISPDTTANHIKTRMAEVYTPQDTLLQYLEHFNNFRKIALPSQR